MSVHCTCYPRYSRGLGIRGFDYLRTRKRKTASSKGKNTVLTKFKPKKWVLGIVVKQRVRFSSFSYCRKIRFKLEFQWSRWFCFSTEIIFFYFEKFAMTTISMHDVTSGKIWLNCQSQVLKSSMGNSNQELVKLLVSSNGFSVRN